MKKVVIILIISSCLQIFGQNKEDLDEIAVRYYVNSQFDSALICYQKLIDDSNPIIKSYYQCQIGHCLFYLKQKEKAKINYYQCLTDTDDGVKRDCCHGLSEIYMSEMNYDSALYYLQLAEKKYPYFKICSAGEIERNTELNYKFAICFNGMGQLDSALKYLTPHSFYNFEFFFDSLKYKAIVDFYLILLHNRYSDTEIKTYFDDATSNIYYRKELDARLKREYSKYNFYNVECYFVFLGCKVILLDGGYEANSWGGEPVQEYSKEYIIEDFKESYLCKQLQKI